MRAPLVIAALVLLAACGKSQQADNRVDADQQLTADTITANDVTAIDAVTGAAANMAADVDVNYAGDVGSGEDNSTATAPSIKKSSQPRPRKSAPAATEPDGTAAAPANTVANSE